jgi:hypothetical protein
MKQASFKSRKLKVFIKIKKYIHKILTITYKGPKRVKHVYASVCCISRYSR